jgi:hypothetical protein
MKILISLSLFVAMTLPLFGQSRTFSPSQKQYLSERLAKAAQSGPRTIRIVSSCSDSEAVQFTQQLSQIFSASGWSVLSAATSPQQRWVAKHTTDGMSMIAPPAGDAITTFLLKALNNPILRPSLVAFSDVELGVDGVTEVTLIVGCHK